MTSTANMVRLAVVVGLMLNGPPAIAEQTTLLIDGTRFESNLVSIADDVVTLSRPEEGAENVSIQRRELLRWGEPAEPARRPTVVLRQGSRLVAAPTWRVGGSIQYGAGNFQIQHAQLADVTLPRRLVRAVLFEAASDPDLFQEQIVLARQDASNSDRVWLTNGDAFSGEFVSIEQGKLSIVMDGQRLEFPIASVVALQLGHAIAGAAPSTSSLAVGLSDGTLIHAESISINPTGICAINMREGLGFQARRPDAISLLQPLSESVNYLSDNEPLDYRHTPYFQTSWPFGRDRGLLGQPLQVGNHRWLKGLAMHASSRLVYRVPSGKRRFQCLLSLADQESLAHDNGDADGALSGSVVCQVFVAREGRFVAAFQSPVLRSGDEPLAVSVDVESAQAIALVTEDAEDGDSRDHCLWLGARLVP